MRTSRDARARAGRRRQHRLCRGEDRQVRHRLARRHLLEDRLQRDHGVEGQEQHALGHGLRDSSITSVDIRNGSLRADDLAAGQLPPGPKGEPGAPASESTAASPRRCARNGEGVDRRLPRRAGRLHGHVREGRQQVRGGRTVATRAPRRRHRDRRAERLPQQVTFRTRDRTAAPPSARSTSRLLLAARSARLGPREAADNSGDDPPRWLPALLSLLALACLPGTAAAAYEPPDGKVWNGLTAGFDASEFESRTGKHAAIWQHFIAWGGSYQYTLENSRRARLAPDAASARAGQNLPERISPGEIARGDGDGFLVGLTRDIAGVGAPVYIRLMGEMNNCNNAYAAYSCSGGRRDRRALGGELEAAWKRTYLIMHGGDVGTLDKRLRARLPPVQTGATSCRPAGRVHVGADDRRGAEHRGAAPAGILARPQWVDWVGTSFYSRFPNFSGLERFYRTSRPAGTSRLPVRVRLTTRTDSPSLGVARLIRSYSRNLASATRYRPISSATWNFASIIVPSGKWSP